MSSPVPDIPNLHQAEPIPEAAVSGGMRLLGSGALAFSLTSR